MRTRRDGRAAMGRMGRRWLEGTAALHRCRPSRCSARPAGRSCRSALPRRFLRAGDRGSREPDAGTRLHAVQLLKTAAYPEAAVPLAPLVTDPQDEVQLEAIAAELNIFLAEPVVPRKRVGVRASKCATPCRRSRRSRPDRSALGAAAGAAGGADRAAHGGARRQPARRRSRRSTPSARSRSQPGGAARRELLRAAGPGRRGVHRRRPIRRCATPRSAYRPCVRAARRATSRSSRRSATR